MSIFTKISDKKILNIFLIFIFLSSILPMNLLAGTQVKVNDNNKLKSKNTTPGQVIQMIEFTNSNGKLKKRAEWVDTIPGLKESAVVVAPDDTGDTSDLEDAIENTIPSSGGSLIILEGTYTINGSITLKSNLQIIGRGTVNIIKNFTGAHLFIGANINNLTIDNIHLFGNNDNQLVNIIEGSNLLFNHCYFNDGSIDDLLHCEDVSRVTVQNCYFNNTDNSNNGDGIDFTNSEDILILDNTITACDEGISLKDIQNTRISHNLITDNSDGIFFSTAVTANKNITITENVIQQSADHGIQIFGNTSRIIINENHISNNTNSGIRQSSTSGTSSFLVDGNIILDNTATVSSFGGLPGSFIFGDNITT